MWILITVLFFIDIINFSNEFVQEVCSHDNKDIKVNASVIEGLNITRLTTKDKINFNITWITGKSWPNESAISVMNLERGLTVFKYIPYEYRLVMESRHVTYEHVYKSLWVYLEIGFNKNEDDETRWSITYQNRSSDMTSQRLCMWFVRADETPFVTLSHEAIGKGRGMISKYQENDKIKITCSLNKANPKTPDPPFDLVLPPGAKSEDITEPGDKYKKTVIMVLTQDVHYKSVECWVAGGDNVTDTTICRFTLKKVFKKRKRNVTIALSLAVFLVVLLLVMTFTGAYLLIVKQRSDTTKELVEHHTHVSQMNTQIMMSQMSKIRASRMSQMQEEEKHGSFSSQNEISPSLIKI